MNSVTKFFTLGFPSSTLLKFGQPSSKSQRSVSSPSHEPTPRHFGGSSVMHSCGVVGPGSSLVVQTDPDSSTAMHTSNFFGHGVGCGVGWVVGGHDGHSSVIGTLSPGGQGHSLHDGHSSVIGTSGPHGHVFVLKSQGEPGGTSHLSA